MDNGTDPWMNAWTYSALRASCVWRGGIQCCPSVHVLGFWQAYPCHCLTSAPHWQWWSWQDVSWPLLIMHDLISKTPAQRDLILTGQGCDIWGPALCHLRLGKQAEHLVPVVSKDTYPLLCFGKENRRGLYRGINMGQTSHWEPCSLTAGYLFMCCLLKIHPVWQLYELCSP